MKLLTIPGIITGKWIRFKISPHNQFRARALFNLKFVEEKMMLIQFAIDPFLSGVEHLQVRARRNLRLHRLRLSRPRRFLEPALQNLRLLE